MILKRLEPLLTRAGRGIKNAFQILTWVFGIAAFLFSVYAFYRERKAEEELDKAIKRINSTNDELQKARYYIDELEGEIRKYEAENEKIDAGIDSLIRSWRAGLQKMREELD